MRRGVIDENEIIIFENQNIKLEVNMKDENCLVKH